VNGERLVTLRLRAARDTCRVEERIREVASYIRVLASALDETSRAEDRTMLTKHLAEAARLVALIDEGADHFAIQRWLDSEEHGYGWSYLPGSHGESAEAAFATLSERLTHGLPHDQ